MKKSLYTLIKTLGISICLCINAIPQASQQYTKTVVNGEEKWTFNKQYLSNFDEEIPYQTFDPKSLLFQRQNFSVIDPFDERWTLQFPYPTDAWLLSTEADNDFIISSGVVFLSLLPPSVYSDLITSSDNGENWNIQRFEQNSLIVTMDKIENYIWLGGYDTDYKGFLLKSTDLGITWEEKLSDDSFSVLYTIFFDANNGVIFTENVGSSSTILKVFHTTDGGDSWTSHTNFWPYTLNGFYTIHFSNNNCGWISDEYSPLSRIINTTDGGMNWQVQFEDTLDEFVMIHFADMNHGWAAGEWEESSSNSELRIYSTTNGGSDWLPQMTVYDDDYGSFGCNMSSLDSLNGWLAVSNWPYLKVYRTTNGGVEWIEISELDLIDFQLGEIEFVSETEGWITSALGMIHYTSDGGYSWTPNHRSVTLSSLETLDFIDSQTGWAAGNSNISGYNNNDLIKTENGGNDWSVIYSDTVYEFTDIDFISDQLGFGISGDWSSHPTINKTLDGGITWDTLHIDSTDLKSIFFSDNNKGWAVGSKNNELFITHTSNSGISWEPQTNINISNAPGLKDVDFVNSEYGFAVGSFGVLIKTIDGGNSWAVSWGNIDPNLFWNHYNLTGVYFPEASDCWIVGSSTYFGGPRTMVAHSTDGGANWDTLSFPSGYSSGDIFFINDSDGYIVGQSYDYITMDGGNTWSQLDYPSDVLDMFFLNEGLGWAVGYNGRIFKFFDPNVGIEEETISQVPIKFLLSQNYPNPFNPSTKISWQSPVGSWQTLKIYDVLGNEIATLVDEYKPAGNYEVEFNSHSDEGRNLTSGIYFYQLQAGEFIETKKMLLLK